MSAWGGSAQGEVSVCQGGFLPTRRGVCPGMSAHRGVVCPQGDVCPEEGVCPERGVCPGGVCLPQEVSACQGVSALYVKGGV